MNDYEIQKIRDTAFCSGYNTAVSKYENKNADLEKENVELKSRNGCETCTKFDKEQLNKAVDIIKGLMRFCRCFAQHHTEDIRYKEAEQFLKEVEG